MFKNINYLLIIVLLISSCSRGTALAKKKYNIGMEMFASKDFFGAKSSWKIACDNRLGMACYKLGEIQSDIYDEPDRAIDSWKRACELRTPEGCWSVGTHFEDKKRDFETAKTYYKKACKLNYPRACVSISRMDSY